MPTSRSDTSLAGTFNKRSGWVSTAASVFGLAALGGVMAVAGVPLVVTAPFTASAIASYLLIHRKRNRPAGPS